MLKYSIILAAFGTVFTTGLASFTGLAKPTLAQVPPDTCLQGYVWREAVPNDLVCVTPETRAQAAYDNSQASARRNPEGGPYDPDTCLQGYVWREAVPNDLVCVTPETRDQAAYDNSQASKRLVNTTGVPLNPGGVGVVSPNRTIGDTTTRELSTVVPSNPRFPQFLGISRESHQEALSDAITKARRHLGGEYLGNDPLNYKEVKREAGLSEGTWVSWVLIELEPNPDYNPPVYIPPQVCTDTEEGPVCSGGDPLPSGKCYKKDTRRCSRK